jgi:hypothetical protein
VGWVWCAGAADDKKAEQQTRALYDILSCVRDVRKRSDRTDAMFEPLKETASLLHAFGIQLGDNVLKQLENADLRWALQASGRLSKALLFVSGFLPERASMNA